MSKKYVSNYQFRYSKLFWEYTKVLFSVYCNCVFECALSIDTFRSWFDIDIAYKSIFESNPFF